MKLDVLICTYNERVVHVPDVLLPYRPDVSYIVSMQYADKKYFQYIPGELKNRRDVKLIFLEGKGLSRNRNHCLDAATGDIALIADDDCRYKDEYFDRIVETFGSHPEVDIAQFMLNIEGHNPIKPYPQRHALTRNGRKGYTPLRANWHSVRNGYGISDLTNTSVSARKLSFAGKKKYGYMTRRKPALPFAFFLIISSTNLTKTPASTPTPVKE